MIGGRRAAAMPALECPEESCFEHLEEQGQAGAAMAESRDDRGPAEIRPFRDTTRNLVEAIWADEWPRNGGIVDFGLRTQAHYESLYYGVREGQITPGQLDAALGQGEALTAPARAARSNPHRDIRFRTDWDDLPPEQEADADGRPKRRGTAPLPGQRRPRPGRGRTGGAWAGSRRWPREVGAGDHRIRGRRPRDPCGGGPDRAALRRPHRAAAPAGGEARGGQGVLHRGAGRTGGVPWT